MYFPAAISSWRSSASNWAGVICRITGGGDKGADEGLKGGKRSEGDCGGNWYEPSNILLRSIISFGFEDSFDGLGEATFRGLSDITGRMETFLLAARVEAGREAEAGTGTGTGTEAEAGTGTGVLLAVEFVGIVGTVGIAETIGAGAGAEMGIVLGMEALSSCARLNKISM
jgi:hypothetical protein